MNCLVVFSEEVVAPGRAVLQGERAHYFTRWHGYPEGHELPVAVLGQSLGVGRVVLSQPEKVEVEIGGFRQLLPRLAVRLIVAVPRPQMIKRIIFGATLLGVEELFFIRTDRGEKSYLGSRELRSERIKAEVVRGLEQAVDYRGPQVFVISEGPGRVIEESASCHRKLLAHGASKRCLHLADVKMCSRERVAIAVGPESGWSEREVERFRTAGFDPVNLGNRVLQVDIAVNVLLGIVAAALRDVSEV